MAIRWTNIRAELFNLRAKVREMAGEIQQRDDIIAARDSHIRIDAQEIAHLRKSLVSAHDVIRAREIDLSGARDVIAQIQDENSELRYERIKSDEHMRDMMRDIADVRESLLEEAKRAAQLHIENDKLRNANRFLNKQADEISILRYTIDETNKCIDFRKREISELKVQLEIARRELNSTKNRVRNLADYVCSLEIQNSAHETTITDQAKEIARLKAELISMTDSTIENEVCGIPATFEAMPGVMGFASCGNGCEIKRDDFGRPYEDHEIKCIESDDFDVSLLD